MNRDFIVFIDFDGTITARDVGYEMFKKFTDGRTQPVVDRYRRGEVNSYTCLKTECEIWNQSPPAEKEVLEFLENQSITAGFSDFTDILKNDLVKTYVISEGFDFYIDAILNSNGFSRLERITNKAVYENGRMYPEFPFLGRGCGECSSCKGFHIKRLTDPRTSAVFIGDGHSDFHGAESADIVFAKSFLKDALEKIGRDYFEYGDFYNIIDIWKRLFSRKVFAFSKRLFLCRVADERRRNFERLWETGEVMKNVGYPNGLRWDRKRYDRFWDSLDRKNFILLAIEDENGSFLGEAKLSFPDDENTCDHDVKLLPEFQGKGYGREAWRLLLGLTSRRWPESTLSVSPFVDNAIAIGLYKSLGFEFDGEQREWIPSSESPHAVPVRYRRMIKHLRGKE
jgi:2,3-diketo-5-methylthio-1-phosphopentane phosphatase